MLNTIKGNTRTQSSTTHHDMEITKTLQKSGTLDNVVMVCKSVELHMPTLLHIMSLDPDNCYPYVIWIDDQFVDDAVQKLLTLGRLRNRVFVNPSQSELMYSMSIVKGFSKGARAITSKSLDDVFVGAINHLVASLGFTAVKPNDAGTINEDLRILSKEGECVFTGEGKSITQLCNITERFGMVAGKATQHRSILYDLFWSFPGGSHTFMGNIHKSPSHFADCYVEFTKAEQQLILQGDIDTILNKLVLVPNNESSTTTVKCISSTLGAYILSHIQCS